MGILLMLKEGGSLGIDTIGNLPIDEDIDLLPDTGASGVDFNLRFMLWSPSNKLQYSIDADELLLVGV
tara:strand:+ start:1594 stop:1797 length:204 start_codon:yes stop_codon:yes gene_type:complete